MCLIDEFDKMSINKKKSLNGTMEIRIITFSKASTVCVIMIWCTLFATINPIRVYYDRR